MLNKSVSVFSDLPLDISQTIWHGRSAPLTSWWACLPVAGLRLTNRTSGDTQTSFGTRFAVCGHLSSCETCIASLVPLKCAIDSKKCAGVVCLLVTSLHFVSLLMFWALGHEAFGGFPDSVFVWEPEHLERADVGSWCFSFRLLFNFIKKFSIHDEIICLRYHAVVSPVIAMLFHFFHS